MVDPKINDRKLLSMLANSNQWMTYSNLNNLLWRPFQIMIIICCQKPEAYFTILKLICSPNLRVLIPKIKIRKYTNLQSKMAINIILVQTNYRTIIIDLNLNIGQITSLQAHRILTNTLSYV